MQEIPCKKRSTCYLVLTERASNANQKTTMTTHTKITKGQIKDFSPVEGTWDSTVRSSEDRDIGSIQEDIEASIERQTGLKVTVQLFHTNGHQINNECPDCGSFIATRR